jgi:hypothetical protein
MREVVSIENDNLVAQTILQSSKWKFEFTGPNQILENIFV